MKTKPLDHQKTGLEKMANKRNFALFMEPGTGKTWLALADAERYYNENKIDGILIIAPRGVHRNWTKREIPTHLSVETITYTWNGKPKNKKQHDKIDKFFDSWKLTRKKPFLALSINIDSVNTKNGYEICERFLSHGRMIIICDESTRIKNPSAQRTKKMLELSKLAIARRILTGTPITRAPADLFSQFQFLKNGLLGTKSYRAFVAEYTVLLERDSNEMISIMKSSGAKFPPLIAKRDEKGLPIYKNLEKLSAIIEPHSYRVKKEDCLDLPNKIYKPIFFEMTEKQNKIYERLKEEYSYIFDNKNYEINEELQFKAIATRTKMKQITSGFINIYNEPQLLPPEDNPRFKIFKEFVNDMLENYPDDQFIVWAMFDQEIKYIIKFLKENNISYSQYTGSTKNNEREQAIDDFQNGKIKFFVGNPAAGGIGITLTAAKWTIYYSCSFDNELRLQSEDRNHRIGTKSQVTYFDFICENTIDEDILISLENKNKIAHFVLDDKINKNCALHI